MPEIIRNGVALLVLVLLLGGLGWSRRRRAPWALGLAIVGAVVAAVLGMLIPSDLYRLPGHLGLGHDLALLLGWGLFGALARAVGRPRLPGPPLVLAVLSGAFLGELGAAAILGASATSRPAAARLAMAAAGGALLGRVGDPALLVMAPRLGEQSWLLLPLGLVCALVAWPMRGDLSGAEDPADEGRGLEPRIDLTVIMVLVGIGAQMPALALPALGLGSLALVAAARGRIGPAAWGIPGWLVGSLALVILAAAAGAPGLIAMGLEEIQYDSGGWLPYALFGGSALVALLADSAASGLLSAALIDRALALQVPDAALMLATGAAVGGMGPLAVAGAVRQGWRILLIQVLIAGFYVLVVL